MKIRVELIILGVGPIILGPTPKLHKLIFIVATACGWWSSWLDWSLLCLQYFIWREHTEAVMISPSKLKLDDCSLMVHLQVTVYPSGSITSDLQLIGFFSFTVSKSPALHRTDIWMALFTRRHSLSWSTDTVGGGERNGLMDGSMLRIKVTFHWFRLNDVHVGLYVYSEE